MATRLLLNLITLFFYCSFDLSVALSTTADHVFKPHHTFMKLLTHSLLFLYVLGCYRLWLIMSTCYEVIFWGWKPCLSILYKGQSGYSSQPVQYFFGLFVQRNEKHKTSVWKLNFPSNGTIMSPEGIIFLLSPKNDKLVETNIANLEHKILWHISVMVKELMLFYLLVSRSIVMEEGTSSTVPSQRI